MLDCIHIDHLSCTIRPTTDVADEWFGVSPGSNGTAATCRRALVTPPGYQWVRWNGRAAVSLTYVCADPGIAEDADSRS